MGRLQVSFACWAYDRVQAIKDEVIRPDGLDVIFHDLRVEETFFRQLRHQEFDIAEMSLSSYVMTTAWEGGSPFVAIPVFPSRYFRHGSIYVRADAGIEKPSDLRGKRVGTAEFQMTASVWQRGILDEYYDLPLDSVKYFTGGINEPGRSEKIPLKVRPSIEIEPIAADATLNDMILRGDLEAIYAAQGPIAFEQGDSRIQRLFPNYKDEEQSFFAKTGIFPIMHTVVIKRELYERHPWIAQSMTKAMTAARDIGYQNIYTTAALRSMLPWSNDHVEETKRVLGTDFWPYGLENNRKVLESFVRYSADQGMIPQAPEIENLFAPESLEQFKI